ncbi:hypothetical protein BN1221_00978 [Brenneria goodwinii]|uniref:Uncharacterized protein n=1 Tax=Brenneria goodwinii TaxID=1109412 RepID=A0A0G4JRQ4_9GAMM|nr:hypothetical protein BN1221_00978 [Brenneria goodwinii]
MLRSERRPGDRRPSGARPRNDLSTAGHPTAVCFHWLGV